MRGWWKLQVTMHSGSEVNDSSKEHIAEMIKQGFTEGEIIQEGIECSVCNGTGESEDYSECPNCKGEGEVSDD